MAITETRGGKVSNRTNYRGESDYIPCYISVLVLDPN